MISDFHDMGTAAVKHLVNLSRHNDVILARISDPLEKKLPGDKLVLSDGDLQLLWESGRHKAGKKFEQAGDEAQGRFEKDMVKHGIPIFHLDTVDPLEQQLKNLFSSRLKKGKA